MIKAFHPSFNGLGCNKNNAAHHNASGKLNNKN